RLGGGGGSLPGGGEGPGRLRRRRRAGALDQGCGQRRGRGLDGRLARAPVPGRRMTVTTADLRTLDLFDDVEDGEFEPWLAAAREQVVQPGEQIAEHGESPPGVVLLLEGVALTLLVQAGHTQPVGRQLAPTWALAIAVLTGGPSPIRMQAE